MISSPTRLVSSLKAQHDSQLEALKAEKDRALSRLADEEARNADLVSELDREVVALEAMREQYSDKIVDLQTRLAANESYSRWVQVPSFTTSIVWYSIAGSIHHLPAYLHVCTLASRYVQLTWHHQLESYAAID